MAEEKISAGERIAAAAKKLVGQKIDSANFLTRLSREAKVDFGRLKLVEKDIRGRRTSEPGDVVQIVEKINDTPHYNPAIGIGSSYFIFVNPATGKVEEGSFIYLAIAKKEVAGIMRIM